MLRTFVKINSVNNLSDARYCAGMGVNDLGFNVEPGTTHYIDPEAYKEIIDWVAGVRPVAEFSTASPETLNQLVNQYAVGALEVSTPEQLVSARSFGLPLIYRCSATQLGQLEAQVPNLMELVEYVRVELNQPEELVHYNDVSHRLPLLISANFSASQFEELLNDYPQLHGIALSGGEEIRAGFKNFDELADVLEALEQEEEF